MDVGRLGLADYKTRAFIKLWGRRIGAIGWDADRSVGVFEYERAFLSSGIEISPVVLPPRPGPMDFPSLPRSTFKGLPGLLADSLPDRFGNLLINRWLAGQGRSESDFDPVERLCYIGRRGMGALEFEPEEGPDRLGAKSLDIGPLADLANLVVSQRQELAGTLGSDADKEALEEILVVGTSAGGARAKAVIAWNEKTGEFRSGQLDADEGFTHWLLKFDGVDGNRDKELADPQGFGRLEFAFSEVAREAGIEMMPCRLHHEGGRAHFMTRRFDRPDAGGKLHMQSLGALRHFDFNTPRAYSYEQAIETIRMLDIGQVAVEEQLRRAFLNVVIRNQDDHVKNIAFLMDRAGNWSLSPAYDVTYAYNPSGDWTSQHQMSLNGKTDDFALEDLLAFGRFADVKVRRCKAILEDVLAAADNWTRHAEAAEVPEQLARRAAAGFRTKFAV